MVRAARYNLPLMLAIIGGNPRRFRPFVDLYHEAMEKYGNAPLPVGMHSIGLVAETDEAAKTRTYKRGWLTERGYRVMEFEAREIEADVGRVLDRIAGEIHPA